MRNISDLYNKVEELEKKICCNKTKFFDSFEGFPPVGQDNTLYVDELNGHIYIWNGLTYVSVSDTLFMFQVGVPGSGHIHFAELSAIQAKELIHGTNTTFPVADPFQPFVIITTESNGTTGDEHVHDLTIHFDYVNHTFIVTDISNNLLYNHEAHLVGAGGGVPNLTATQIAYGDVDGKMTSSSDFVVDNTDGLKLIVGAGASSDATATLKTHRLATNSLYVNDEIFVNVAKYGLGEMYCYNTSQSEIQFKVSAPDEVTIVEYGRIGGGGDGNRYKFNGSNSTSYVTNAATDHKFGINTDVPTVALDVRGTVNISQVLTLASIEFSNLPTGVRGMLAHINDSSTSTWGDTITGGGSDTVLAFYNGSNWTVMGK